MGARADPSEEKGRVMIRWVIEPVHGKTRDPYKRRTGERRTLWILFFPVYSKTIWDHST